MRGGSAPNWMQHVIPALVILALVLWALSGCVTVSDCRAYVRGGIYGECAWDFKPES